MQLSINVKGELVRKGLQNLAAKSPKIGRQQIRTVINRIVRRQQAYPPEPAHRTRTARHPTLGKIFTRTGRTGLLGRSWKVSPTESGYTLSNTAKRKGRAYGQYVQGDAYGQSQAWMHKGRWELTRDVTEEEVAKLPADIEKAIMMVARKEGL